MRFLRDTPGWVWALVGFALALALLWAFPGHETWRDEAESYWDGLAFDECVYGDAPWC